MSVTLDTLTLHECITSSEPPETGVYYKMHNILICIPTFAAHNPWAVLETKLSFNLIIMEGLIAS